jgi:predicted nucleotidyltransferase
MLVLMGAKVSLPEDLAGVLEELDRGLRGLYGERYRGLVLFGSYARGEAGWGSDVDLLLLLDGEVNQAQEILRAGDVVWPLSLESGYLFGLMPVNVEAYRSPEEPYLLNARGDGVSVP